MFLKNYSAYSRQTLLSFLNIIREKFGCWLIVWLCDLTCLWQQRFQSMIYWISVFSLSVLSILVRIWTFNDHFHSNYVLHVLCFPIEFWSCCKSFGKFLKSKRGFQDGGHFEMGRQLELLWRYDWHSTQYLNWYLVTLIC